LPNYTEYLDPIGEGGNKCHIVHQAILNKIKSDGRKSPQYNIERNVRSAVVV